MAVTIERSLRLPDHEFFAGEEEKTGIAIHHTVGGNARSTLRWWEQDGKMVGTAYIIGRDGAIYEAFPPNAWAWQFGLPWSKRKKVKFEKRFVGIELASEGALTESNGKYYCFDRITPRTEKDPTEVFDYGRDYRGYRYFDTYEPAQVDALIQLIDHLCTEMGIRRRVPERLFEFYGEALANFDGIIGHTMVRNDKTDPAPNQAFWDLVIDGCNLEQTVAKTSAPLPKSKMAPADITALWEHNVQELNKLYIPAGSLVKGLLIELERSDRNTYIRLRDAVPDGHRVRYDYVQGDRSLISVFGRVLGFKTVTENELEVAGG